jgi:Calcineurin-like phosphoesterase
MAELSFVCLSDLHLGAPDSVLTEIGEDGQVVKHVACETLVNFSSALRATVQRLRADGPAGAALPTLVLLGDILDLGLSPMGQVAREFGQFIDNLFPPGSPPVFDKKVLMIPGNHDHHLWRMAQDKDFLSSLENGHIREDLISHNRFSKDRPGSQLDCQMLTAIMRQRSDFKDSSVHIAYPNMCLIAPGGKRAIMMHHGHYIDPTYRLMSTIFQALNGEPDAVLTAEDIERQNGAWVDFLWSDLGSAGAVGREAFSLYELMGSASASHAYAKKFSEQIEHRLFESVGISGKTPLYKGITAGQLIRAGVQALLSRSAQGQRNNYLDVLPEGDLKDLVGYLNGPVKVDLTHALQESGYKNTKPEDIELGFIFGHTHKPFQREVIAQGFSKPVSVYNTGGWVMDMPTGSFTQGASAMFINSELDVAALRIFNDPVNGDMTEVNAQGIASMGGSGNPMVDALDAALKPNEPVWSKFSRSAKAKLQMQADLLLKL